MYKKKDKKKKKKKKESHKEEMRGGDREVCVRGKKIIEREALAYL